MTNKTKLEQLVGQKQFELKQLFRKNGIIGEVNAESVLKAIREKDSTFYVKVIDILNGTEAAKFANYDPTLTGPDPGYTADGTYVEDINNGTGAKLFTWLNNIFTAGQKASSLISSLRTSITGESTAADLQLQLQLEAEKARQTRTYLLIGAGLVLLIIAILAFKK